MNVAIMGLGYVGLPLAIESLKAGHKVVGFDVSKNKIEKLANGISYIEDIPDFEIKNAIETKRFIPTSSDEDISNCEVKIICVPTPLTEEGKPDLGYLISALEIVGMSLKRGDLVIIESTVAPGTTRQIALPILESKSGLSKKDFLLSFSPERIDPKNSSWNLNNTPKLVSGMDLNSQEKAHLFYGGFIKNIIICESIEVAEMAKLLENSFRLINISFINEISILCQKIGINVNKVISAASSKPYGFMPFYPGIGIGGHCIPVDPIYLLDKAEAVGTKLDLIKTAIEINESLPMHYTQIANEMLGELENKKIIVIGVSYKANIADIRETPVKPLIDMLRGTGAKVFWHDDLVNEWVDEKSTPLSENFDLAIICSLHTMVNLKPLGNVPVLDTRGNMK
jgi:UDP-N-acetyl-D-glucosamine dehydrogenase